MNLFIPPLGTKLRLLETFGVDLKAEYRNEDLLIMYGYEKREIINRYSWGTRTEREFEQDTYPVVFDAGTVLTIERIYIRKGSAQFDSVTFQVFETPNPKLARSKGPGIRLGYRRFWVSLADANRIVCEIVP